MNTSRRIRTAAIALAAAAMVTLPASAALATPHAPAPAATVAAHSTTDTTGTRTPAWPVTLGTQVTFTNNTTSTLYVSPEMTDSNPRELKPGESFTSSGDYIAADDVDIWVSRTRADASRSDMTKGKLNITGNNPRAGYPWLRVRGAEFPSISHGFSVGERWSFTGTGWGTFEAARHNDNTSYKVFTITLTG